MYNKYSLGYKTNLGSLIEVEGLTIEEAFKEGVSILYPKTLFFDKTGNEEILYSFALSLFKEKNKLNVEDINEFFKEVVDNQKSNTHQNSFKFVTVSEIKEEFHLCFEVYDEGEERFEPVTTEHANLFQAFAYAMECLFPECSFHFTLDGNTLKYTYQADNEDDHGEGEIEYTVEAMNEYIKDFIENNETDYSSMSIVNWTKFCAELQKERTKHDAQTEDLPF